MGRYDLREFEWSIIEPLMPMDRRGPMGSPYFHCAPLSRRSAQ